MTHRHVRVACVALSAVLSLAGCGDDDDSAATATSAGTSADETTTSTAVDAPDEAPSDGAIEISVAGGAVTGGGRHEIPLGESVVLRVTSDVADEVHLHGYDLFVDVVPGQPAELTFDATIPGVFEAELEDAGVLLAELQIR